MLSYRGCTTAQKPWKEWEFFLFPCTLQHWILPDKTEPPLCQRPGSFARGITNQDRWQWIWRSNDSSDMQVEQVHVRMHYNQERGSQVDDAEQTGKQEGRSLVPSHPDNNALIHLPHPCKEISINGISSMQTSSTVATLNGLDLTVVGVVVGRGCIRACHRPIIER